MEARSLRRVLTRHSLPRRNRLLHKDLRLRIIPKARQAGAAFGRPPLFIDAGDVVYWAHFFGA